MWVYDAKKDRENPLNYFGYAINSLPVNKRGAFMVPKTGERTSKKATALIEKAFAKIDRREYEGFLRYLRNTGRTEELPAGYENERTGFGRYLNTLAQESGLFALLLLTTAQEQGADYSDQLVIAAVNATSFNLIMTRMEEVYKDQEDYQYTPPTLHQYPNDKISHNLRSATEAELKRGEMKVLEVAGTSRRKPVISKVRMDLSALHDMGFKRLTAFDFYVFHTCLSIQSEGNKATSLNSIYRALTGKTGKVILTDKMETTIVKSLMKVMSMLVEIDADGICKMRGSNPLPASSSVGNLLPAFIKPRGMINGTEVGRVVVFSDTSPLVKVVKAKGGQFVRYETELLNVPVSSTQQNISVIHYLLNRIEDTRTGKVHKTIFLDDIISFCEYKGTRARLTELVEKCFTYWQSKDYIKTFKFVSDPHIKTKIEKVTFTLHPTRVLLPRG